jgi:Purple acid Phosphatase, N-terminal domain
VAGYTVLRDGAQIARVDLPNGLRYSDNSLAPASSHVYSVSAVDSAGNVSAPTTGRTVKTLSTGALLVARGPYISKVTSSSAVVSWWTNLPTPGVVSWGLAAPTEHSVNDPRGTLQHHSVTLSGLKPATVYKYRVGNGGSVSTDASFSTAAQAGQTFTFAAIGDFGGGSTGETQNANNIAGGVLELLEK